MVQRRIRAAHFPAVKSLDTFDFLAIPSVNKALVMELARCEYIERRENIIAVGNSGAGKTHIALGLAACQRGMSVGFTTAAARLFEVFNQRYERGSILVTTNLPFDEWTDVFGSERLTGALLDRLTHQVHILEMNRDSYRLKGSRQNTGSPPPDQPAAA